MWAVAETCAVCNQVNPAQPAETAIDQFLHAPCRPTPERCECLLGDADDPMKAPTDIGPLISLEAAHRVEEQVGRSLRDGATLVLGGSIYTRDPEAAMTVVNSVKAGWFRINDPASDNDAGPFGGIRRALGAESAHALRPPKRVHSAKVMERKPWWFPLCKIPRYHMEGIAGSGEQGVAVVSTVAGQPVHRKRCRARASTGLSTACTVGWRSIA
jgi:hypothetical protein